MLSEWIVRVHWVDRKQQLADLLTKEDAFAMKLLELFEMSLLKNV